EAMPGPADRLAGGAGDGRRRLGGGPQRADDQCQVALHHRRGPHQAPSTVSVYSLVAVHQFAMAELMPRLRAGSVSLPRKSLQAVKYSQWRTSNSNFLMLRK